MNDLKTTRMRERHTHSERKRERESGRVGESDWHKESFEIKFVIFCLKKATSHFRLDIFLSRLIFS